MTTLYGALVGTPRNAHPLQPVPNVYKDSIDKVLVRDRYEFAGAAAASVVEIAVLPWETVIDPYNSDFSFDDLGATVTMSIGDVTYPTALANAVDVHTAAGTAKVMTSVDIANYYKPLWQVLGYATLAAAKLIGASCQLLGTVGSSAATGTMVWQLKGAKRLA